MTKPPVARRILAALLLAILPKPSSRRPADPVARYIASSFPSEV